METHANLFTLITGASSGIGRETAIRLSKTRKLLLHGRDVKRTNETKALCSNPDWHECWDADLLHVGDIEASLSNLMLSRSIAVECFVHSAGMLRILPMRNMELKSAEEILKVNFLSSCEIVRVLLKNRTNKRNLKNIVFISSIASNFGARGMNLYCASKGALDALMRALAVELAPDIRVNSVLPGGVKTKMTDSMLEDPEVADRLKSDYPLGLGSPEDIAAAVEFLISDQAKWVTGQQLTVDGGRGVNITA